MPLPDDDLTNVFVGGCVVPETPWPSVGCLDCGWMGWNTAAGLQDAPPILLDRGTLGDIHATPTFESTHNGLGR
jgi:hypothetical protein